MASPLPASRPEDSPSFQIHTSIRYDPSLLQVHLNPLFTHAGWNYKTPSPLYMLPFHRDRILRAAVHFNWTPAIDILSGDTGLANLTDFITSELEKNKSKNGNSLTHSNLPDSSPKRLRITITKTGSLGLSIFPYPKVPVQNLFPSSLPVPISSPSPDSQPSVYTITIDPVKTTPSEYTHFKTTHRPMYDAARQRAQIETPSAKKEVLLVNDIDGSIMEGSITTPYFFRSGRWVTPPVSTRYSPKIDDSGGNDGTSRRWAIESGLALEELILADSLTDGEECWLSNGASGFFPGRINISRTTSSEPRDKTA